MFAPPSDEMISDSVIVETNDGHQQILSRRFLAEESVYFRALFGNRFADSLSHFVRVPFTSSQLQHCFAALKAAMKGVAVYFDLEYAYEALNPASYLCMDRLLHWLTNSILAQVDVSCIVDLYHYAIPRHPPLAFGLWSKIIKHFDKIAASDDFLSMTQEELISALDDESLNIASRQEMTVLSKYVQAKERDDCEKVVALAVSMIYTGDGAVAPVVKNRVPSEVVMVVGGWSANGPTDLVETFNPRNYRWLRSPRVNSVRRAYHSLSYVDGKMYVVGGMDGRAYFNSGSVLDLKTMNLTSLPDMSERRCYLSSAVVNESNGGNRILMAGGYNGTDRLNTCEIFSIADWSYTKLNNMYRARSDAAAVLLGDTVAVVGGFDGRHVHPDVEMIDFNTGEWRTLSGRMRSCRTGVSAVPLDDKVIFVAGGFNGTTRLSSGEFYDIREGLWHALPRMNTPRSNSHLEYMNGYVYACGGFDGSSTTAGAERFDLVAQRWEQLPPLSLARSALRMVRVDEPSIVRRLVHFDADP